MKFRVYSDYATKFVEVLNSHGVDGKKDNLSKTYLYADTKYGTNMNFLSLLEY